MDANPTVPREELLAPPGSRSRRLARLMYTGSAFAAFSALGFLLLALRLAAGFGGDRTGELVLGGVMVLVALFFAGVSLLAFRAGRERLRQRHNLYYPGF